jgi:hypothetical protein
MYLFRHAKGIRVWSIFTLSKLQNLVIVVIGQNLSFQVICQKMPMFEQLNDQLLVNSK